MSYRLISKDSIPQGGFPYQQTGDKPRFFPSVPTPEMQAQMVSAYRRVNGLPRGSINDALQDIVIYTCARLNNNPSLCVEVNDGQVLDLHQGPVPCKGCGAKIS